MSTERELQNARRDYERQIKEAREMPWWPPKPPAGWFAGLLKRIKDLRKERA